MKKACWLLVLLLTSSVLFAQTIDWKKKLPIVNQYIDSLMKDWNIPGLAIAIVQGDKLVYAKGFGYRNLEQQLPVDTSTLFPIASNSKLFTATALAEMDLEHKLSLDAPVRDYLPQLHFSTDELNAKATLRDLLSHRTGLPRYDAFWAYNTDITRDDLLQLVQYMKPQYTLREGYIYNNVMYATAGIAMEKITDSSWESIIRKRLFNPLQMKASCFLPEEMTAYGNYSLSYYQNDSSKQMFPITHPAQSLALGPAGTIKSTVGDMSHWMIAQLNKGQYKGIQAIPAAAIEETLLAQNVTEKKARWPELSNSLYCLGRTVQSYKGYQLVYHTGSIDGFYSNLSFLPGEKLGIFMVHNATEAGSLRSIMALPVFDILLGLPRTPWISRYKEDYGKAKAKQKKDEQAFLANQQKETNPSHPLADYTGIYKHPAYGQLTIKMVNGALQADYRHLLLPLHHYHYDQFRTDEKNSDLPDFSFHFRLDENGHIAAVEIVELAEVDEVVFEKEK